VGLFDDYLSSGFPRVPEKLLLLSLLLEGSILVPMR
jgi:hypothetical protein